MQNKTKSFVINPFALAELVAGKAIKWDRYDDQVQAACNILNITKEAMFSENCPIMNPYLSILGDGSEKVLSSEEARERLVSYLNKKMTRRITKKPVMRKLTLKALRNRIPDLLIPVFPPIKDRPDLSIEEIRIPEDPIQEPSIPGASNRDKGWDRPGYSWLDMGEYFKEVPEFTDPRQGPHGDCYFISALSSVVWTRPYAINNNAKPSKLGDDDSPYHKFTFYKSGKPEVVEVSEKVLVNTTGSNPSWYYARSTDNGEVWPAVIEKAYAKWRTGTKTDKPNMDKIIGGVGEVACMQLIGGEAECKTHSFCSPLEVKTFIKDNCEGKKAKNPMFASTPSSAPEGLNYVSAGIYLNHTYSILGWTEYRGQFYVVLRNPWAHAEATIDVLNGEWNYDGTNRTPNIQLNRNGIFAIKLDSYLKYYYDSSVVKNDVYINER